MQQENAGMSNRIDGSFRNAALSTIAAAAVSVAESRQAGLTPFAGFLPPTGS